MDAGELNEQVTVLELSCLPTKCEWQPIKKLWGKAERLSGNNRQNLFSRLGLGAKTVVFTTRKCKISLHNALRWQGKHHFITDIKEVDRSYYEITTAVIEPTICLLERAEVGKDALKRPIALEPTVLYFPACLTEKYLGYEQGKPMAVGEVAYVLVAPKAVVLRQGDLVWMPTDGEAFVVNVCHVLDEYKNEYEMMRRADV